MAIGISLSSQLSEVSCNGAIEKWLRTFSGNYKIRMVVRDFESGNSYEDLLIGLGAERSERRVSVALE